MPRLNAAPRDAPATRRSCKLAKGNVGGRRKQYRQARETVEKGLAYAYRDRRVQQARVPRACGSSASTPPRACDGLS